MYINPDVHSAMMEIERLRAENGKLKQLAQRIIDAKNVDKDVRNVMYYVWLNVAEKIIKGE